MFLGEHIASKEKLIQACLEILQEGKRNELYSVLPYIGVVRSPSFLPPLLELLQSGRREQQEFAAVALGSLGDSKAIGPLHEVFVEPSIFRKTDTQSLQAAIIMALGQIGDEGAIGPLLKIYDLDSRSATLRVTRRMWVLSAIGNIAQQGSMLGVKELTRLMRNKDTELRAHAVNELAVAFWHRPNDLPDTVLQQMLSLTRDGAQTVRNAAFWSLSDLADLGCSGARQHLRS